MALIVHGTPLAYGPPLDERSGNRPQAITGTNSGKGTIRPSLFYHTLGREMKGLGQGPWTGKTCNDQRVPRRVGMAPPFLGRIKKKHKRLLRLAFFLWHAP